MSGKKITSFTLIIFLIIFGAALLRFWRLESLTTFMGDQGYDFIIVKRMVAGEKFTMLGPKIGPYNQQGNLYLGPAYYYLLTPALLLSNLDPIGPAILTVILAILTVAIIYIIGTEFFSKPIAALASAIYAFNPFLISQSRASSNPHLIPFFSAAFIYATLKMTVGKSKKLVWQAVVGISLGIMFQLHYLASALFIPTLIMLAYFKKFKEMLFIAFFFVLAISPQIIFELRHKFFVTNLLFKQLTSGDNLVSISKFLMHLNKSLSSVSAIFVNFEKYQILNILAISFFIYLFLKREAKLRITVYFFSFIVIFGFIFASLYSGSIGPHYFTIIYVPVTILISVAFFGIFNLTSSQLLKMLLAVVMIILFISNLTKLDLNHRNGYTMPVGWNQEGVKKASKIIAKDVDNSKKFNVAATLDGDTRAMPYRYLLEVYGKNPQKVENYPDSDILYLISRDVEETIKRYTVWEVSNFAPFNIDQRWEIQNGIKLFKLTHKNL